MAAVQTRLIGTVVSIIGNRVNIQSVRVIMICNRRSAKEERGARL